MFRINTKHLFNACTIFCKCCGFLNNGRKDIGGAELLIYACFLACIYLGMFLQRTNKIVLSLRYKTCNTQPLNLWFAFVFLVSIGVCVKRSSLLCFPNPIGIIPMHRCHHTCKTWGSHGDITEDWRHTSYELVNIPTFQVTVVSSSSAPRIAVGYLNLLVYGFV
jgi:hypothetical protein